MRSAVTLKEVATLAGVSAKTASRVINADPAVTEKTAARVRKAIEILDYTPNPHARSLRTGRDQAIALVVDSISDPFFAALAEGAEQVAQQASFFLIVAHAGDSPAREREVVDNLLRRSISGVILVPSLLNFGSGKRPLGPGGVPVVAVDRPLEDFDVDTVLVDNAGASHQAVAQLIAHGHRRIGFLGNTLARFTVRERLAGYRRALEEADLAFDESLVALSSYKGRMDRHMFDALLSGPDPVTALFSSDALTTQDIVRLLHGVGRTDIAFIGFDDFVTADSLTPPVSVVRQDPLEMGRTAAQLLLRRIHGDHSPPERVVLPTVFVARGSGEIRAPGPMAMVTPIEHDESLSAHRPRPIEQGGRQ